MTRLSHKVDVSDLRLANAIRNGKPIRATCGERFVPIAQGDGARRYPECPDCHPRTLQKPKPTYVYRCYNAAGRLLYVGCTISPRTRIETHRASTWWFHQVDRVRFIVFPHRDYALEKEREAIASENPRWNIKGRWGSRDTWTAADFQDYYTALLLSPSRGTGASVKSQQICAAEARLRFGITLLGCDAEETA